MRIIIELLDSWNDFEIEDWIEDIKQVGGVIDAYSEGGCSSCPKKCSKEMVRELKGKK